MTLHAPSPEESGCQWNGAVPPLLSDDADLRSLRFHGGEVQSLMSVHCPTELLLPYTRTMMGFLLWHPHPVHILMVGLGGGSLVKFCYQHLPHVRITVVEINPYVIALRQRFQIPEDDARLHVVCADGADYVRGCGQRFDVILVDGFDVQGQSPQLASRAFYGDCARALRAHGVLAINLDADHPEHALYLQRLHKACQGSTVEVTVPERANLIVFAMQDVTLAAHPMCLDAVLEQHPLHAQPLLRAELQRIRQLLDGLASLRPASM